MILIKSSRTDSRFSRRGLLRRLGASAALLPLVGTDRVALAQPGAPKRLITMAWPHGVAQPHFFPQSDDPTGSTILAPFKPVASKTTIVAGLDIRIMLDDDRRYDGHFSYPSLFSGTYRNVKAQTGTATGPSVDQFFSDAVAKSVKLQVPLMNITPTGSSASYRGDDQKNSGENDPARLYRNVFAGSGASVDKLAALRARRASVLDFVGKELDAFGQRLGTDDRNKIGAHHDSIRKLEAELDALAPISCEAQQPTASDYRGKVGAFIQLIAVAIRCDLTRAVSMTLGDDNGYAPQSMPWVGINNDYHNMAHDGPGAFSQKVKGDTFFMEQIATLATLLDATQEANGKTALDNSVILAASDMNEGHRHDVSGIPFVLVGNAGGAFRSGRVVRVGNWAKQSGEYWKGDGGVPHNRLLASVMNALGVPVSGFGAKYSGTLSELA